jgi:hypothetical protein
MKLIRTLITYFLTSQLILSKITSKITLIISSKNPKAQVDVATGICLFFILFKFYQHSKFQIMKASVDLNF